MSPAPLCQAVTDFESDSDHLSTPVDPPASCQPYVAEYAPLQDSYYDRYEGVEYVPGHPAQLARSADSEYLVETTQSGLLLRAPYQVSLPSFCAAAVYNLSVRCLRPLAAASLQIINWFTRWSPPTATRPVPATLNQSPT